MRLNFDFDIKGSQAKIKTFQHAINPAIAETLSLMVTHLKFRNFEKRLAPNLEIAEKSGKLRPFTRTATLFKKANKNNLQATLFMKDIQADYLKYAMKRENYNLKLPTRQFLIVPDEDFAHRKKYGQPNKRGGVKKHPRMFWLKNKKGGHTLFRRYGKGRKMAGTYDRNMKAAWHTTRSAKYNKKTLNYYDGAISYINKRGEFYRGVYIKEIKRRAIKAFKSRGFKSFL